MKKVLVILFLSVLSLSVFSCGDDESATPENNSPNISLVETFYGLADSGNSEEYSQIFSDSFVDHNRSAAAPESVTDKASILNTLGQLSAGFPDGVHNINVIEAIGDDRVVVSWIFTGTNTGEFFGAPASNNTVAIGGIDIFRIEDGKFIEQWHVEDLFGLFAQIGG